MSKKLLYSVLTGIVAIGVLAACGEVEEDPATDNAPMEEEVEMEEME
ncbi:hypothetical protein [Alteribacillus iranensis]|uniref:Uncharacterized protein n=1 Tax=Alteribacillus iranensis TaxID=930128 RepID=A0A1I2DF79_9BACI|nr:hypothetical protein [Alteribacillus iranensis]SFE79157.1 hypothetical protein SAMN05192532_10437 [Alteribacillus iranensis]